MSTEAWAYGLLGHLPDSLLQVVAVAVFSKAHTMSCRVLAVVPLNCYWPSAVLRVAARCDVFCRHFCHSTELLQGVAIVTQGMARRHNSHSVSCMCALLHGHSVCTGPSRWSARCCRLC